MEGYSNRWWQLSPICEEANPLFGVWASLVGSLEKGSLDKRSSRLKRRGKGGIRREEERAKKKRKEKSEEEEKIESVD
jgi:hypothetical protein